jgi:hypothetical protein
MLAATWADFTLVASQNICKALEGKSDASRLFGRQVLGKHMGNDVAAGMLNGHNMS